jgi:Uma2 family endonuclease
MPSPPDTAAIELAPDWICEVLSPSTARLDLALKLPKYLRAGVMPAWILNPAQQTIEIFKAGTDGWRLLGAHGGDEKVRAEPFDAVASDLAPLWLSEGRQG